MRKLFLLITIFCLFLVSCDATYVELEPTSSDTPTGSVMTAEFGTESVSTKDGQSSIDINIDEIASSEYIKFTCQHTYKTDTLVEDPGFTFSCESLKLVNVTSTGCMIDASKITYLGSFIITAKSNSDAKFDQNFILNITSNVASIKVSYQIQKEYTEDIQTADVESTMLEGDIDSFTKKLELISGVRYDFTIYDTSDEGYTIKGITTSSSDPEVIYFLDSKGSSGTFVCEHIEDGTATLKFSIGGGIEVKVRVTLKDVSEADIHILVPDDERESVLSFEANKDVETNPIYYNYQIDISTAGGKNERLVFSTNFYDWSMEEEEKYVLDPQNYVEEMTPISEQNWSSAGQFGVSNNGKRFFTVWFDGGARTLSILPYENDSVFTSTRGTANLHLYIYVRYASDPAGMYRWRWRVLIGGILEGIDIYTYTSSGETRIQNNLLEINEGDATNWTFRSKNVPGTTDDKSTLWYLAKSLEVQEYNLATSGKPLYATLPVPAEKGSDADRALTFPFAPSGSETFGNLTVNTHYHDSVTSDGVSELYTVYGNSSDYSILVCVNLNTGLYNYVIIKNTNQSTIIVSGLDNTGEAVPVSVTTLMSDILKDTEITVATGYDGITTLQSGPNVTSGSNADMTFYMPVDSRLVINMASTFDLDSVVLSAANTYAFDAFSTMSSFVDSTTKHSATLIIATKYYEAENKTSQMEKECLNDNALLKLSINGKYNLNAKIIVYKG